MYVAADADFEEVLFQIPHTLNCLQPFEPSFAPKAAGQLVRYHQEMTTTLIHHYHKIRALVRERTDVPILFGRWDTSQPGVFAGWRLPEPVITSWANHLHTWLKLIRSVPASSACLWFLFVVFWATPYQQPAACWSFLEMLALIRHSSKTITSVTVTETGLCAAISLSQALSHLRLPLAEELLTWAGCADPSCGQRTSLGKQVPRSLWSPSERLQYSRLQVCSPLRESCLCLA